MVSCILPRTVCEADFLACKEGGAGASVPAHESIDVVFGTHYSILVSFFGRYGYQNGVIKATEDLSGICCGVCGRNSRHFGKTHTHTHTKAARKRRRATRDLQTTSIRTRRNISETRAVFRKTNKRKSRAFVYFSLCLV